jgi:hypothetical protein
MKFLKNNLFKQLSVIALFVMTIISCDESSFVDINDQITNPSNLTYADISDAREGKSIVSLAPSVQTNGLVPSFEIVNIKSSDGSILDASFLNFVSVGVPIPKTINISPQDARLDQNGNPILEVNSLDLSKNGIISIDEGHTFVADDYSFTIKVTVEFEGEFYTTTFDDGFKLTIQPLLPSLLIYSPKNQNLVFGDSNSVTTDPIVPNSNPEIRYELETLSDKLQIDENTGAIRIASSYNYTQYDTLKPTINVISKISGEVVKFEDVLTAIITDTPVSVPREDIYFFYPTLFTSGSFPSSGDGFSVQVDKAGNGQDIWGVVDNSAGKSLATPDERPADNTDQTALETQTFNSGRTQPTASWMVTETQDLTPFQFGYFLSFNYYYQPAYQTYLPDGRTPTDLEVYISTDYTGGDIQDEDGNFTNGTWEKVNTDMRCYKSLGTSGSISTGAPWGPEFIGTPYPGNQNGADPDGRKRPGNTFYNKWVKCSYDIPISKISTTFTVAFKVASYFTGEIANNASAPGRGGTYFMSDFHYKAAE